VTATTPPAKRSFGALPTLLSVMFINVMGFGIVVPLLPFYAKSFNAEAWQIALIFSAYSIGAFFGEPIWGRLSDRIGRRPLLLSTIAGNCLCYFALAFAPNVTLAFLIRLVGGFFSGNASVVQGYIADMTRPEERTRYMSYLGASFNLGFIVGPAVGGLLAHPSAGTIGFRIPLLCASAMSALCLIGLFLFVRESRVHTADHRPQASRWQALGDVIGNPAIGRMMLITFLAGSAFMGIESIFGLWTQARFDWGPHEIGWAFALSGVAAAICQIYVTYPLSRTFGQAPMLAVGLVLAALCMALQPVAQGLLVFVLLAAASVGQSVAWPNVSALISRHVDPDRQGQFLGLNNATGAFARFAGPLCMAFMFSDVGLNAPFYVAALLTLPAVLLAWISRHNIPARVGETVETIQPS
jgi:MFS family permease